MNKKFNLVFTNCSMYSYLLQFIIKKYALVVFSCFVFYASANSQEIVKVPVEDKDKFILALPSYDCFNCKAMSFQIMDFFKKSTHRNELVIVTDDDAGAYYLSQFKNVFDSYSTVVDKSLCMRLTPDSKSTLSYVQTDTITIEIKYGIDSLLSLINELKSTITNQELNALRTDSIYIKFNIFKEYGNYIFCMADNLFLYSRESDAGCYLLNRSSINNSIDTLELIKSFLSNGKYDSLYKQLFCSETSNVPQNIMREISKNNGIPLTKIYSIANDGKQYYLLYNFFTGHSDTIRGEQKDNVNLEFVYNLSILNSNSIFNADPIDISFYQLSLRVTDSLLYANKRYKVRTITDFGVSDKYIYLPVALEQNSNTIDSLFFIAKFNREDANTETPLEILYYPSGHFSEYCFFRMSPETPILINKIKKLLDFGDNDIKFSYENMPFSENDAIKDILDFFPQNTNDIKIIASTINGKNIVAHLVNKSKIEKVRYINIPEEIIHCNFLNSTSFVIISNKAHKLFTKKFYYQ